MFLDKPYLPQQIDDVLATFPAHVKHLMPPEPEIPAAFRRKFDKALSLGENKAARLAANPWLVFQHEWFYHGLGGKVIEIESRDGIDDAMAIRHLSAIQHSFEPDHNYKEAAVAYLASLWFKSVSIQDEGVDDETS